jgi:hypothetical protein
MTRRNLFASLVMMAALVPAGFAQTFPPGCPNKVHFGLRPSAPVDQSVRAQVDLAYFTTADPNTFISERAGLYRSASNTVLGAEQFNAALIALERDGLARIQKRQTLSTNLGELAAFNLERDSVNAGGVTADVSLSAAPFDYALGRETEISVTRDARRDGDFYRLNLLSWFVDATADRGGFKTVDYDASILLKPGQTLVFKLVSDFEVRRTDRGRKYVAVTLRSARPVMVASLRK